MKHLLTIICLVSITAGSQAKDPLKNAENMKTIPNVTLTVLYDNYTYDKDFRSSWGFSCLIEGCGKTILFDTGGKDGNLMHNFKVAGKDPGDVDLVILTHNHWDHTGGLPEFLDSKTGIDVYLPASFPDKIKEDIKGKGSRVIEVENFGKITDFVWTTGEMGKEIIEQSLVIETGGGLIVLTGCAHPGIERIVEKAMEEKGEEVLLVIGGFHLLRTGTNAVESIAGEFRKKGVKYAAPTHCSGDGTIKIFSETFDDFYIQAGAGRVINTADL